MGIIVIDKSNFFNLDSLSSPINYIGQKAWGLLDLPSHWRLPFLCISSKVLEAYQGTKLTCERESIVVQTAKSIRDFLPQIGVKENDDIIIRSSGVEEDLSDRGRYDSGNCAVEDIENALTDLFDKFVNRFDSPPQMAFVVQKYINNAVLGHLSNERRFSEVKRDWIFEYDLGSGDIVSDRISVRYWRTGMENVEQKELVCCSTSEIPYALSLVAGYYAKRKIAIHIEFIWDGSRIIIAQADPEKIKIEELVNPTDFNIKVNVETLTDFKVLRKATEIDSKYTKVKNSLLYRRIGLCTVPLYILDKNEYIRALAQGTILPELEYDLRLLANNTVVVRTDIANADKDQGQLLARSNDIRDYDALKRWLIEQKTVLNSSAEVAFLFHIFIPAIGAAFVNASPVRRLVEIEALWGLPEGLYYNAHDQVTVDTKSINPDNISEENLEILSKRRFFKQAYFAPNEDGSWISKKTAPPYDWSLCIDDKSIRQIAIESRKIAGMAQQDVSVMWFLGIDEEYYGTANLAWHHEKYSASNYTTSEYKKKYFYETERVISSYHDYESFVNSCDPDIKEIIIRPSDDKLLRDKDFLKKVGDAAVKKGATVILEGAVLAHPFYQLCRTGARVLTPNTKIWYREKSNYSKLVRDKIPDMILQNGEDITCYVLEDDALFRALMEKAVEEAIEIASASTDDLIEELGDEYEVISSILLLTEKLNKVSRFHKKVRIETRAISSCDHIMINHHNCELINKTACEVFKTDEYGDVEIGVSYEGTRLQIEMHFFRDEKKARESLQSFSSKLTLNSEIESILKYALSLTSYTRLQDIKRAAKKIQCEIFAMLDSLHVDKKGFLIRVNKKRDKRGGFANGYLLKSSTISSISEEELSQTYMNIGFTGFKKMAILDYSPVKNADYLEKGGGELVLRVSLPICFNMSQVVFDSNTVKKYIGGNNSIIVEINRNKATIGLSLAIRKKTDQDVQLSLQL